MDGEKDMSFEDFFDFDGDGKLNVIEQATAYTALFGNEDSDDIGYHSPYDDDDDEPAESYDEYDEYDDYSDDEFEDEDEEREDISDLEKTESLDEILAVEGINLEGGDTEENVMDNAVFIILINLSKDLITIPMLAATF